MVCELTPPEGLFVAGLCPDSDETIALISPDEPRFWALFTGSPEYADGAPDPMDRWSKRVIGGWAADLDARAVFPSDGPPFAPFAGWALASGRCWQSPVGMLVHDRMGLFISFRGALILPHALAPAAQTSCPCDRRHQPCRIACPAEAFRPGHDAGRCHDWLGQPVGQDCINLGCAVRRACPISESCGRLPEQSAWHMRQFHP